MKTGRTRKISLTKKQKRMIIIGVITAIAAMTILTFLRSKTGEKSISYMLYTIYIYFCGYVPNFSIRLNEITSSDYTHGYVFLFGLLKPVIKVIYGVLDIPLSNHFVLADSVTTSLQTRVDIGGGINFNAYVSPFYYFFLDLGFVSLIVETFIFGVVSAMIENRFSQKPTYINAFLYIFIFYLIISSIVRWEMVHPKSAMVLYYMFLIFRQVKPRRNKRQIMSLERHLSY